jgi:hypothetical protein
MSTPFKESPITYEFDSQKQSPLKKGLEKIKTIISGDELSQTLAQLENYKKNFQNCKIELYQCETKLEHSNNLLSNAESKLVTQKELNKYIQNKYDTYVKENIDSFIQKLIQESLDKDEMISLLQNENKILRQKCDKYEKHNNNSTVKELDDLLLSLQNSS